MFYILYSYQRSCKVLRGLVGSDKKLSLATGFTIFETLSLPYVSAFDRNIHSRHGLYGLYIPCLLFFTTWKPACKNTRGKYICKQIIRPLCMSWPYYLFANIGPLRQVRHKFLPYASFLQKPHNLPEWKDLPQQYGPPGVR